MSIQKINPRLVTLFFLIIAAAIMRIPNAAQVTPWANYTPIGAMALFGGAYFTNRFKAIVFPLLALFVSDLIINNIVFDGKYGVMYNGWYIIYGIFLFIVFIGKMLIRKVNITNVILASVVAALGHWFIADFTVWLVAAPICGPWHHSQKTGLDYCNVMHRVFLS